MSDNLRTLRLCVVGQRYQVDREYLSIYEALERRFDLTTVFTDDGWPAAIEDIADHERYDAILWFVRFRELIERPAFRWGNYAGMRLMYDQDAYQNFSHMAGSRFLGAWPDVVQRNELDVLLCTGRATRDNLIQQGVRAVWLPKAADESRFHPLDRPREGFCYFGERYAARAAMLAELQKQRIKFERFTCSYFDLNERLNRYVACFICNMEAKVGSGMRRVVNRLFPSRGLDLGPAPEAMLKNFEVAASGCVPFCDAIDELGDLGFRDGETAVTYRDFTELVDKARAFERDPSALAAIGRNAAELVRTRHTWHHRAEQIATLVAAERGVRTAASERPAS
jgi:hypothetical protein